MSVHDEHETGEFVRRPARHEARLHHQEHQRSAIGASPRPSIHMPRLDSAVLQSLRSSRNAYLLNGLLDERRTKNRDCKAPGGSPHFWSDTVNLKGTASARDFAAETGIVCQISADLRAPCQIVKFRLRFDTCPRVKFRAARGPPLHVKFSARSEPLPLCQTVKFRSSRCVKLSNSGPRPGPCQILTPKMSKNVKFCP